MKERNEFLEADGLIFDNGEFEWFADKSSTSYAQRKNLLKIVAYITRNKETGEYKRVLVDHNIESVIYASDSLESIGVKIDQLALIEKFNKIEDDTT